MKRRIGLAAATRARGSPLARVDDLVVGDGRQRRRPLERDRRGGDLRRCDADDASPAGEQHGPGGDGARRHVRRRRRDRGRLRAVRDRRLGARRRVDRRRRRAGRPGRPRRTRARAGGIRPERVRRVHGGRPGRERQGERQGRRRSRRGGDARAAHGRRVRRRRPLRPADARPRRVRADRRRGDQPGTAADARRREARQGTPVHLHDARLPAGSAVRAHQQGLRGGRRRAPADRRGDQHHPHGRADGDRAVLHRPDLRAVQPRAARPRQRTWARRRAVGAAPRLHVGRDRRHDDRLLGGQVPLPLLASEPRDPEGRHGRQRRHDAHSDLAPARDGKPPRVPVGARAASPPA